MIKGLLLAAGVLLPVWAASAADPPAAAPFEIEGPFIPANLIDEHVLAALKQRGIEPARLCSDEVFVRRAFLDVIGTLPEPDEVVAFLKDKRTDKRAALIDDLLKRDEFADYWSLKWCDLLRVKAEFPINLWPNAVQAYHHWVREAVATNTRYDEFARELLTATGSNFRVGPVNFCRAVQGREAGPLAAAAALTFMGARIEGWPAERRAGLEALFSRVAYKSTAEWKEEIICVDPGATVPLEAMLPDGTAVRVGVGEDPRRVFADWLTRADNEWFAKAAVNRVWAWMLGRGIVEEADDLRADNPGGHPELLAALAGELVGSGYDLRQVYRLIANSRTYQQSAVARCGQADAERLWACYPVRRLDAEVLIDALNGICGAAEKYSSPIPEPFTYIPEDQRTIALADGSISSPFLELFGRPARDTGLMSERDNVPTDAQRLYLLNSSQVHAKIRQSGLVRRLQRVGRRDPRGLVETLYLTILSRYPTEAEVEVVGAYRRSAGTRPGMVLEDVVWALVNTKEFLYRH